MPPSTPRLRILSVGGNAVSAFLSWRLSATQACDVTLVWKNGYEMVHQYGVTFRSDKFGNERFKPRHVVRSPEEAAGVSRAAYDYVLLCVKALPDVYDLASVIESVVSPQHTCILINTTHSLGIESYIEQRFPTNVVLSLISGAEITQLGASEFEHKGASELWVGAANKNPAIPASIQNDMAEALSMTLRSGDVDCQVSSNIKSLQYQRMIGPIAFHPTSVLFETPSHAELIAKTGAKTLISGVIDEVLAIAKAQGCQLAANLREETIEKMTVAAETNSMMYQDFSSRRPMEVETFLGSPLKVAQELGIAVPRIETLYALLHNANTINLSKPQQPPPQQNQPTAAPPTPVHGQRMSSLPGPGPKGPPYMNGNHGPPPMRNGQPGGRGPPMGGPGMPPGGRRRPSMGMGGPNPGQRMHSSGYPSRMPPQQPSRRASFEGNDLEEFSHLVIYNNEDAYDGGMNASSGDLALREREFALRQKELALRERELNMRQSRGGRPSMARQYDDEDDDGEDYFDPMAGPHMSAADADNLDMMSVTSRRTRKTPSASQLRGNPDMMAGVPQHKGRNPLRRPPMKNRASATIMAELPGLRDELMNNPLVGYSSDRYGHVDRMNVGQESRTNSLTAERLSELQQGGMPGGGFGPGGYPTNRRGSQSPGNPLMGMNGRPPQRPSPPNGYAGPGPNGRPSPPGGMRQPMPRHPPGHNNAVAPHNIEIQTGVSSLYPPHPKGMPSAQVRSLTGSASASAGSGDSNRSAPLDSEPSAHSSSSSLGPRPPIHVR